MRSILVLCAALLAVLLVVPACTPRGKTVAATPGPGHFVLVGGRLPDGRVADVEIRDGVILAIGDVADGAPRILVRDRWIVPAFIDSHVHLAYLPIAEALADGGVAAAVDLAAPVTFLGAKDLPVRVVAAGPMITAPGGYPTRSWGRDGYGLECANPDQAEAAVATLADAGAALIKVPLAQGPRMSEATLVAAVEAAHARGLKVAVHALTDPMAARAARAGADILAHTPVAELSEDTVAEWSDRTVITTLRAFGGSRQVVANLEQLRIAGATVLYGTDLGNGRVPGIDEREIDLMARAGFDPAGILAAGTTAPAAFWGFDELGAIEVGRAASLLILARDPAKDPLVLADPEAVYIDGRRR